MKTVSSDQLTVWDETIEQLAQKRSRIIGVDLDDLIQEGRMAVLLSLMGDFEPIELDILNAMRRWIRAQKRCSYVTYDIRTV